MEQWLAPGATVLAMSAFNDLDPAFASKADRWFLGNRTSDVAHIVEAFAEGGVSAEDVSGTLGELLVGKVGGRKSDEERILYTHMGMGAHDIAVGALLCEQASAKGIGQHLKLA
jgi:ornithine cyclodeaminase/alanine dehydrogenase-like protein (mu-crystallin family)